MLLLVAESLPSCSSGGPPEDVFAVRLTHIIAVLDSLLLLLSLLLFGSMPSSPVGRIRLMLHMFLLLENMCNASNAGRRMQVAGQVPGGHAGLQVGQASFLVSLLAGNPEFPFFIL